MLFIFIRNANNWVHHCIKYARMRVFTDAYSPVYGQNRRFCPYKREYRDRIEDSVLIR